jgi:hypothetical protein
MSNSKSGISRGGLLVVRLALGASSHRFSDGKLIITPGVVCGVFTIYCIYTCQCEGNQIYWCHPCAKFIRIKKAINLKSSIKINYNCTIGFRTKKSSQQNSTSLYFDELFYLIFLINVKYFV